MSAGWVAGSARARLLLTRRLGETEVRRIAEAGSLEAAAQMLAGTRFAPVAATTDLESADRAVATCLLIELRLLSGWLPTGAGELIRSLAAWFELVNVEDRLAYLSGAPLASPFALGSLNSAWPGVAAAQGMDDVRSALRRSAWGDPGAATPQAIHLGLRLVWARRIARAAPEARSWAAGALALLVARERFISGLSADDLPVDRLAGELGRHWVQASTLDAFAAALPPRASWAVDAVAENSELWRAEAKWWRRVRSDAASLVRASRDGRAVVVGAVALLAADAVRASAALAVATRSSNPAARDAFDALV